MKHRIGRVCGYLGDLLMAATILAAVAVVINTRTDLTVTGTGWLTFPTLIIPAAVAIALSIAETALAANDDATEGVTR